MTEICKYVGRNAVATLVSVVKFEVLCLAGVRVGWSGWPRNLHQQGEFHGVGNIQKITTQSYADKIRSLLHVSCIQIYPGVYGVFQTSDCITSGEESIIVGM